MISNLQPGKQYPLPLAQRSHLAAERSVELWLPAQHPLKRISLDHIDMVKYQTSQASPSLKWPSHQSSSDAAGCDNN